MGWKSHHLDPWLLQSKLGLVLRNKRRANGTYDSEVRRLGIRSRKMVYDPSDSRRKDKLIIGCCIPIDIHKRERKRERENEMRGKIYSKVLNEGKQKPSTRLYNEVIVRQRMENKSHHLV